MRAPGRSPTRTGARSRRRPRAAAADPSPPPHPLVSLQWAVGNRAVQRLLRGGAVQRTEGDGLSLKERAEAHIYQRLADCDRDIKRDFEALEDLLGDPDERARKGALVREVHRAYLATGAWTEGMLDALERAILPVKNPYPVDQRLSFLRKDAIAKAELLDGLDDPVEWQQTYYNRLRRR